MWRGLQALNRARALTRRICAPSTARPSMPGRLARLNTAQRDATRPAPREHLQSLVVSLPALPHPQPVNACVKRGRAGRTWRYARRIRHSLECGQLGLRLLAMARLTMVLLVGRYDDEPRRSRCAAGSPVAKDLERGSRSPERTRPPTVKKTLERIDATDSQESAAATSAGEMAAQSPSPTDGKPLRRRRWKGTAGARANPSRDVNGLGAACRR
jgi:hypothetical protein